MPSTHPSINPPHHHSLKPITVIGSIVYDLVMPLVHLPVIGETVPGTGFNTFIGGKGLNQAIQIHRLEYPLNFFGRVGDDKYGTEVFEEMSRQEFPTEGIRRIPGEHTAMGMIFVAPDGRNMIGGYRAANINFPISEVDEPIRKAIAESSIVSLQLETPDDVVLECLKVAKKAGVTTILNAAPCRELPDEFQKLVDFWVVNEIEAGQFFECNIVNASDCCPIEKDEKVKAGSEVWVVTLGSKGAAVIDLNGIYEVPGIKVDAVDSTGAGDSFTGGFAVGLAEGLSPRQAADFANVVASQSVTKLGGITGLPRRSELGSCAGNV
jgi:ribokinase